MDNLTAIARQAMIEHKLLPDFSPEAQRQAESTLQANSNTAGLDVGDRVRVELVHVDPERGFIDFARAR